jgi:DNA helicase HerA-like ATPase
MAVKNVLARAGGRVADKVAKLASLSPDQLQTVQKQREDYLSQKPDPTDTAAEELTKRLLAASSVEIYNAYLAQIKELYIPVERNTEYGTAFDAERNIRFFNITKWVVDKDENSLEKLVNVYEVLSNEDCNISLVFHRTCETTKVFLAVTNTKNADNNVDATNYSVRLADALKGNFPGSEWAGGTGEGILPCLKNEIPYSVAVASNIPTEKSEKFISQTIEKLIDGIVPSKRSKEYIIILLATPIRDIEYRKLSLAEMYSALAPYASWTTTFTYDEHSSVGSSSTVGVNIGASAGIQNGQNQSVTDTEGTTDSTSNTATDSTSNAQTDSTNESKTDSTSDTTTDTTGSSVTDSTSNSTTNTTGNTTSSSNTHTDGTSTSQTDTSGTSDTAGLTAGVGGSVGFLGTGVTGFASGSYSHGTSTSIADMSGTNISDAVTQGISSSVSNAVTNTAGKAIATSTSQAIGKTAGTALTTAAGKALTSTVGRSIANTLGKAVSKSVATTAGIFSSVNYGVNFGASFARSSNVTATIGKSEGINQSFTNYNIKHTLEILEAQMKRLELSTALGMWDFAAYVMSEDQNVANNVAHSYIALTQGEESFMSQSAINLWRGDMGERSNDAKEICNYLRELRHPVFGLNPTITSESPIFNVYPPVVTATTGLSGKELAYSLNFPKKSIPGLPVIECAEFGRNVTTYDVSKTSEENIEIGKIYHMNHEEKAPVNLAKESLASHTFITGSTGSGKSNTVYRILSEAVEQNIKFLVIEPAKGEYKNVFGTREDVAIYGTNPKLSPLLRINPFRFPDEIHILEHLDRLVEIFNVCWPMYAAMPAVLKNAVEKSYMDCGWDLLRSVNKYNEALYPSFSDVARNIKEIIDTSEYDTENKGAYKGSLLTRLESLTNGIYGVIFSCNDISDSELFNKNVIIDLSRVGSSETKSLIMGMLVLKLSEHRMAKVDGMNAKLKHITVLEEAHNLLKRTSTEQSSDGANLLGKSVEMLANAIAEMRTYGEGFIIADQAPGLLDLSVIRNTNTKIIMRLPDRSDRELVGRAASLNDDQITELAKLPCGVAAVYQNEWVQPVLCKVYKNADPETRYAYTPPDDEYLDSDDHIVSESLLDCIMKKEIFRKGNRAGILKLKSLIIRSKLDTAVKRDFLDYISSEKDESLKSLRHLVYSFLSAAEAIEASRKYDDLSGWVHGVVEKLSPAIKDYPKNQIDLALALIIYEQAERDAAYNDILCKFTEIYKTEGGVF